MSDIKSVVEAAMGNGGVVHISNVMGKFKCHKVVSAARISDISFMVMDHRGCGLSVTIQHPDIDDMTLPYFIPDSAMARYTPKVGDYVVLYDGDYVSVSPKEAFESGYRLIRDEQDHIYEEQVSFSAALDAVKSGKAIRRAGWNGSGLSVKAQYPDAHSKMSLPYLYIEYPENAKTTPGARCPWLASQTDIMADDWVVIS